MRRNYNKDECPVCKKGCLEESPKRTSLNSLRILDGNKVLQCPIEPEHKFWRNSREGWDILHQNPEASVTNFDSIQDWVYKDGEWWKKGEEPPMKTIKEALIEIVENKSTYEYEVPLIHMKGYLDIIKKLGYEIAEENDSNLQIHEYYEYMGWEPDFWFGLTLNGIKVYYSGDYWFGTCHLTEQNNEQ